MSKNQVRYQTIILVITLLIIAAFIINGALTILDPKYYYGLIRWITPLNYCRNYMPEGEELALVSKLPAYATFTMIPMIFIIIGNIFYIHGYYNKFISWITLPLWTLIALTLVYTFGTMEFHDHYDTILHNFYEMDPNGGMESAWVGGIANFIIGYAGHGYWYIFPIIINVALMFFIDGIVTSKSMFKMTLLPIIFIALYVLPALVTGLIAGIEGLAGAIVQFVVMIIILGALFFSGRSTYVGHVDEYGNVYIDD